MSEVVIVAPEQKALLVNPFHDQQE
jgi:hypothetical protein